MKKTFNTPEMIISTFSLENIVLASGEVPVSQTAVEKAKASLGENGVNDVISLQTVITL